MEVTVYRWVVFNHGCLICGYSLNWGIKFADNVLEKHDSSFWLNVLSTEEFLYYLKDVGYLSIKVYVTEIRYKQITFYLMYIYLSSDR